MHQLIKDTSPVAFPVPDRSLSLFKRCSPFELVVCPFVFLLKCLQSCESVL